MSVERQSELPSGYIWKECTSINARFPMPENWFFKEESVPGTESFFMTREPIIGESITKNIGRVLDIRTTGSEGHFKTGLSVNTFLDFYQRTRVSPSSFARNFLERPPKVFVPKSQLIRKREGPLVSHRRFFLLSDQTSSDNEVSKNFYIETTSNGLTGRAYLIMFETPSDQWNEDKEIALTMIENRILDKAY